MTFYDVIRWSLQAKAEERLALMELLEYMARPQLAEPGTLAAVQQAGGPVITKEMFIPGPNGTVFKARAQITPKGVGMHTAPMPPGQYTARIDDVKAVRRKPKARLVKALRSPRAFEPRSSFTKSWWKRLQRASTPLTAEQLNAAVKGGAEDLRRISGELGQLYRRGIVSRQQQPGSKAFLYSYPQVTP